MLLKNSIIFADKKEKMSNIKNLAMVANNERKEINLSVSFFVFSDKTNIIAYCPSLDLSTSGKTEEEAEANFHEMLQLYVECEIESNTLHQDLMAHGWSVQRRGITPPTFHNLMRKPDMKRLMNSDSNFKRTKTIAKIPAFV